MRCWCIIIWWLLFSEETLCSSIPSFLPRYKPRIVGGDKAPSMIPWQVQVIVPPYFCGGTILDSRTILSAAHCTDHLNNNNPQGTYIRAGSTNQNHPEQVIAVESIVYDTSRPYNSITDNNDIVILKLAFSLTFDDNVQPASMPSESWNPKPGTKCMVSGWGALSSDGNYPDDLQYVVVPIVSQTTCNVSYPDKITSAMICAGYTQGGKDSCQGDSGGPLVCPNNNGQAVLSGVVSFGNGCARPNFPGVYARVSTFLSWIKSNMESHGTICMSPRIIATENSYDHRFPAHHIFSDICEGTARDYFLLQNGVKNKGFVVDLGCEQPLHSVTLKNTHNGNHHDRGTKDFSIEGSYDFQTWQNIVDGTLPNAWHKSCHSIPHKDFYVISGTRSMRYLRFRANSFYGSGAGLQTLTWTTHGGDRISPRVVHTESQYDHRFPAHHVFSDTCEDQKHRHYFLLPNGVTNKGFIIDLGYPQQLYSVLLKNTHNGIHHDRGTNGFTIELSMNQYDDWIQVFDGYLPDARHMPIVPKIEFKLGSNVAAARYLRFRATSYYGSGAGLQTLAWKSYY